MSVIEPSNEITVYWRPGCMFCSSLRRQLRRNDVPHRLVDIHEEPAAAAFVRSVANGNETVPTVRVGPLSLVNPGPSEVLDAVTEHAPHLLPPAT
jgi:mycoredoxin